MSNDVVFNADYMNLEFISGVITKNIQDDLTKTEGDIADLINYYVPNILSSYSKIKSK